MRAQKTKKALAGIAENYVRLSRLPLADLYEGALLEKSLVLVESGLVVSLKGTPNKYGDAFVRRPFTMEFTYQNRNLDLHIWNDEGIITNQPISFAGMVALGKSKEMLADYEHDERGLQCELFCESDGGNARTIKVFSLSPDIKRLISCSLRAVDAQGSELPLASVKRHQQRVQNV